MTTSHDHTTELAMTDAVSPYTVEEIERSRALALLLSGFSAEQVAHMLQKSIEWVTGF